MIWLAQYDIIIIAIIFLAIGVFLGRLTVLPYKPPSILPDIRPEKNKGIEEVDVFQESLRQEADHAPTFDRINTIQ